MSIIEEVQTLLANGDISQARDKLMTASKDARFKTEALYLLGKLELDQQNPPKALEYFTESLSSDPSYAPTIKVLAPLLEAAGALDQILPLIKMCAEKHPQDEELQSLANRLNLNPELKNPKFTFICIGDKFDHFIKDLARGFADQYDTKILCSSEPQEYIEEIKAADIIWLEWANAAAIIGTQILAQLPKKRVLCRLHSYEVFIPEPQQILWEHVDDLIYVAPHIKKIAEQNFGSHIKKAKRTHILPNGIDLNRFKLNTKKPGKNVAFLGQVNFKKGPMLLMQAALALVEADPKIHVYIGGDFAQPRYKLYFDEMMKDCKQRHRIHIEGRIHDVPKWLKKMDFILCTSVLEGHPVGIMESMACGLTPLIHTFYGAKGLYPEKYLWRSIDDLVEMVKAGPHPPEENRAFIEDGFQLSQQIEGIREIIE